MILSNILLVKRVSNVFEIGNFKIPSDRQSTDGFGVLLIFSAPSKLDRDFRCVLGPGRFAWFPTAKSLDLIRRKLDLSDHLTCDLLHGGEGWKTGPRPFSKKLADLI